jgi:hypothetical protein
MMVHSIDRPIDLPANIRLEQKYLLTTNKYFYSSLIFANRVGAYCSGSSYGPQTYPQILNYCKNTC